jgi:hypothetical protein
MKQRRRRSGIIIGLLALSLLAGVALTARPAQAVDAVGPYYAEPAWDQKIGAATRFVVLTNWASAAVLDKETGLVWEKSPDPTPRSWAVARFQCASRTTGNRKGWRLPSFHELASLIQPVGFTPGGPTIQAGHPFLGVLGGTPQLDFYWSATTDALNPTASVWGVGFDDAGVGENPKSDSVRVWCVRGGGPLSDY